MEMPRSNLDDDKCYCSKGDLERRRAEIYAVNNYLKVLEGQKFEALKELMQDNMNAETWNDVSWGSEYSSEDNCDSKGKGKDSLGRPSSKTTTIPTKAVKSNRSLLDTHSNAV